jgi:hypothetical protein
MFISIDGYTNAVWDCAQIHPERGLPLLRSLSVGTPWQPKQTQTTYQERGGKCPSCYGVCDVFASSSKTMQRPNPSEPRPQSTEITPWGSTTIASCGRMCGSIAGDHDWNINFNLIPSRTTTHNYAKDYDPSHPTRLNTNETALQTLEHTRTMLFHCQQLANTMGAMGPGAGYTTLGNWNIPLKPPTPGSRTSNKYHT